MGAAAQGAAYTCGCPDAGLAQRWRRSLPLPPPPHATVAVDCARGENEGQGGGVAALRQRRGESGRHAVAAPGGLHPAHGQVGGGVDVPAGKAAEVELQQLRACAAQEGSGSRGASVYGVSRGRRTAAGAAEHARGAASLAHNGRMHGSGRRGPVGQPAHDCREKASAGTMSPGSSGNAKDTCTKYPFACRGA